MSDIFISYSRADRDRAQGVARALGELGFEVWWDRKIPPGKTFDQVIQEALDASDCVVVLWSKTSVASDWVKEEAQAGLAKGCLVPVLIDDVPIPLGFGRIQTANLVSWNGEPEHPELDQLARSAAALAGGRIDTRSYRLVREDAEPERPQPGPKPAPRPEPAPLAHQPVARVPPREPMRERKPEPLVVKPVTIPTPAPSSGRSQAASSRRLPLVAALVAILLLSVAGVAYYVLLGRPRAAPVEVSEVADDAIGTDAPAEPEPSSTPEPGTPDVVLDDEPEPEAAVPALDPGADLGLPAPARVVPASLADEEVEAKDAPTRMPEPKLEAPKEARRPVATPAAEPDDPATAVLRRAASADLPLHARRDLLSGNEGTLGDARAENRVGQALQLLREEMEFSAAIIDARSFVVGSGLVRDGNGTPNGATGVAEELRPGTVYLFARVRSPESESLKLEWRDGAGRVLASETIRVGRNTDPGYRVGVDHTITERGRYEVRLYNQKGALIGLRRFEIGG